MTTITCPSCASSIPAPDPNAEASGTVSVRFEDCGCGAVIRIAAISRGDHWSPWRVTAWLYMNWRPGPDRDAHYAELRARSTP